MFIYVLIYVYLFIYLCKKLLKICIFFTFILFFQHCVYSFTSVSKG